MTLTDSVVIESEKFTTVQNYSRAERQELARLVMKIFEIWGLTSVEQALALGRSPRSGSTIKRYRSGNPVAPRRDLIWRVVNILAIYRLLRSPDFECPDRADKWMTTPNPRFGCRRPIDMTVHIIGIDAVRSLLEANNCEKETREKCT